MIPDDLRALTVRQPHASAIVGGLKDMENRRWPFPAELGSWIAIHAGMKDDGSWRDHWPSGAGFLHGLPLGTAFGDLPHGEIIGVVRVVDCIDSIDTAIVGWGTEWAIPGYWHWQLRDAQPLRSPIKFRGRQGLMPLPVYVCQQIRFQVDG